MSKFKKNHTVNRDQQVVVTKVATTYLNYIRIDYKKVPKQDEHVYSETF